MLDPAAIVTDRTIWATADAPQGTPGTGSKDSPLRLAGNLDAVAGLLGASARLNLMPGMYQTNGLLFPSTFILDAPHGGVTIRLRDNSGNALNFPHVRMLRAAEGWASFVSISGIIWDANWKNQGGGLANNFKIEPLVIQSLQARVTGCTIRNWGCAGDGAGYYLEAFPLSLTTVASGDAEFYLPIYQGLASRERTPSRLEIIDCIVEPGTLTGGAYCTGIFVRTCMGTAFGDRQPMGTRTTESALVRGNRVNVPGGICYGAGGSKVTAGGGGLGDWGVEQTLFEDNEAEGKCAMNIDTGRLSKVKVLNNIFLDVSQGPAVTPDVAGDDLEFRGNTIQLSEPFQNAILGRAEDQWGIRCQRVTNIRCTDNNIAVLPTFGGQVFDGFQPGQGNVTTTIRSDSTALAEARAELLTLSGELAAVRADLLDTTIEVQKLEARNIELKQRLASASEILNRP